MSEIVWDDETQTYVRSDELKLRKLKQDIINELLDQLVNNYELDISIDLKSGTGKITIKRKQ
jgi:hypothetical protein